MYLNADVPAFRALVRAEYLYNLETHHGEHEPCYVFGVTGILGRALGFHVMLANGAQFARLPLSALCHTSNAPRLPLHVIQPWDSLSYHLSVHVFTFLAGLRCDARMSDGETRSGTYLFTIDWAESDFAEAPAEHKNHHVIQLDDGNYAAMPNNLLRWHAPFFITPYIETPRYKRNTHIFSAEQRQMGSKRIAKKITKRKGSRA
jgi:hypothetical protein